MTERAWHDLIVGDRMAVDQEFAQQVSDSQFSRQEWGLIMTAVEFDIEHPEDPERARLVADTSKVADIMPEVERAARMQRQQMGGSSGGGFVDSLKDALGFGGGRGVRGGVDQEKVSAAVSLVESYTAELQTHLERQGRWEETRLAASAEAETEQTDN